MTTTVKLPNPLEDSLRERCAQEGRSISEVMRDALAMYLATAPKGVASAYELGADLFGRTYAPGLGITDLASQRKAYASEVWDEMGAEKSARCAAAGSMSLSLGPAEEESFVSEDRVIYLKPKIKIALIDSGPLLALFNQHDSWHERVTLWLQANPQVKLVSTWPVMTEVCAMLARRVHHEAALDFLRWAQRGALTCDAPVQASLAAVLQISVRFASLPFDLADASIAEAASRLSIRHILSVDADFDVYRDPAGMPLDNVLRF